MRTARHCAFSCRKPGMEVPGDEQPESNFCLYRTDAVRMYLAIHPIWWSDLDHSVAEIVVCLRTED